MYLGEVIKRLEQENDLNRVVPFGFAEPMSYRGFYDELAFRPCWGISVGAMLNYAREAMGATFEGYKGGEYKMGEWTQCWIDNYGSANGNGLSSYLLEFILGHTPVKGPADE